MQEREELRPLKREKKMSREGKVKKKYVYGKERKIFVANMASYAISLSLILVIHDNMIIGTNQMKDQMATKEGGVNRSR
jgi:phosphoribosylaminoimidazole-succinocarboxamide synthase